MFHVKQNNFMEKIPYCLICSSDKFIPFIRCKDYTVSQENFELLQCSNCNFVFTNPRPPQSQIGKYYKAEDYISHTETQKGFINKLYHFARIYTIKQKLSLIEKLSPKGNLLDIGCGTGNFLASAKNNGWNITGIETDADARNIAHQKCSTTIFDEEQLDVLESQFNIITMWHVLEHVHELKQRISQLKRLLKPDGSLIIAVPNCASYDAQHYKEFWAAYDVPRHLYHFKPENIEQLFSTYGLEVTSILPMKLDAYYVAMLSEKYKGGNFLSAIWHGFKSNWHAKFHKYTYSSQIYIIKHK